MKIINTDVTVDYSPLGLGFVSLEDEFINKAGVTDPTTKAAIKKLKADLVANNLWYITANDQFYLFIGSTQASQKWVLGANHVYALTENGAGAMTHGAAGVTGTGSGTQQYYTTDLTPPAVMTPGATMGFVAKNASARATNTNVFGYAGENTGGVANTRLSFGTGGTSPIIVNYAIGLAAASNNADITAQTAAFWQVAGDNTSTSLMKDALEIKTTTQAVSMVGGGTRQINLMAGMVQSSGAPGSTTATDLQIAFAYIIWQKLTVLQRQTMRTIVNTFLTSIGR